MGLLNGLRRRGCAALAVALAVAFDPAPDGAAPDLTLSLDLRASLTDATPSFLDGDRNPIDLTEAFVELRPMPRGAGRTRLRAGLFYPPSSLQNRAPG